MKTLLNYTVLALTLFLYGCSASQYVSKVSSWVEKHCPKTEVANPLTGEINIYFKCDSLWQTQAIQDNCKAAKLCIDISNGSISGNVRCNTPAVDFPQLQKLQK